MGLFTAVFVDSLMDARAAKERAKKKKIQDTKDSLSEDLVTLLRSLDTDNTGALSPEEISNALKLLDDKEYTPEGVDHARWHSWIEAIHTKMDFLGFQRGLLEASLQFTKQKIAVNGHLDEMPAEVMVTSVFEMDAPITKRDSLVCNAYLTEQYRKRDENQTAEMRAEIQSLRDSVNELRQLVQHLVK